MGGGGEERAPAAPLGLGRPLARPRPGPAARPGGRWLRAEVGEGGTGGTARTIGTGELKQVGWARSGVCVCPPAQCPWRDGGGGVLVGRWYLAEKP